MAAPTIADYLKYASLQMAAEAFLKDPKTNEEYYSEDNLVRVLFEGNKHASRFTESEAEKFKTHWKVLDQIPNTLTGFSGALFECIEDDPVTGAKKGEYVISFRSTEFIDDAVRDSESTNNEIKELGFAFGQLTDMEDWYESIKSKIPPGTKPKVTGYSLGGHLATAFNLMHQGEIDQVITFNGAGNDHLFARHADMLASATDA
jgi:hypothetical protein